MISGKWLVLDELNKYIFLKSWGQRFPKDTHDQMVAFKKKKKMKLIELYICIFFLNFFTFLLISHKYKQVETHRSTSCYLYFLKQQNSNTFMNADLFRLILVLIHPQLPGEYFKKTASGRGVFPSTSIFVNITLWFPMLDHNHRFFCKAAVNFILKLYFEPNIFIFFPTEMSVKIHIFLNLFKQHFIINLVFSLLQ